MRSLQAGGLDSPSDSKEEKKRQGSWAAPVISTDTRRRSASFFPFPGAEQAGAGESGAGKADAGKAGAGKANPGESGAGKADAGKADAGKAGLDKAASRGYARGSLTAETAIALPVFVICLLAVIHLCNVLSLSVRLGSALSETAQEMAIGAYASAYEEGEDVLQVVLSHAWATGRTLQHTGKTDSVRNLNLLLSSFREKEERIDLVATYQVRLPVGMVGSPRTFWVQRGTVRAWTGREGSGETGTADPGEEHVTVYVAENGQVYHTDANCTHIKLSISRVPAATVSALRNTSGARYRPCEHCGREAGSQVYITLEGNRYHSSLSCSGLKRTVHQVHLDEVEGLRPCSRCAGG